MYPEDDDINFINYYEVLGIPEDASTEEIAVARDSYQENMIEQLNNSFTMKSARYALDAIVPGIQQHLLSGPEARRRYDQQLNEVKRKQTQAEEQDEPPEDQGLDTPIQRPFFFDPDKGYDTELPAYTLREIARHLDQEWEQARSWITDTRNKIHPFVGYLIHAALRRRLAERIGQIIQAVTLGSWPRMDVNEGIERCITTLNPQTERPMVRVYGPNFDGRMFDAGTFISDRPAQSELILSHEGLRGCTFGTVESRTNWVTFQGGQSSMRFALIPEGSASSMGPAEVKLPLFFQVQPLVRGVDHIAELVIRMENWNPPRELPVYIGIHIPALPPRVWFEPAATPDAPLWAGRVRRGMQTSAVVTARNAGDEEHIPLVARLSTKDSGAGSRPERFHANEPITLTIDTSTRQKGSIYDVVFNVDYNLTPGAHGPATLHVRGEILPTPWQSMLQEKALGERVGIALVGAFAGFLLLGGIGAALAGHLLATWFLAFLIPILLAATMHKGAGTILAHIQRSGDTSVQKEHISPQILWGIPIGIGILLALLCGLIVDPGTSFLIGGLGGGLVGAGLGFVLDKAQPSKTETPPYQEIRRQ